MLNFKKVIRLGVVSSANATYIEIPAHYLKNNGKTLTKPLERISVNVDIFISSSSFPNFSNNFLLFSSFVLVFSLLIIILY